MKIEVLGTDCMKCRRLAKNVEIAVAELGISAEIEKVEEITAMMERGVMLTPALVVDGDLKVSGRVADVAEIKAFLQEGEGVHPLPKGETVPGTLVVEWRHIGESVDATCERCAATGRTLAAVVDEIRPMLAVRQIKVKVVETVLPPERIAESNIILFNGTPLEDLLEEVRVETTPCVSCSCIAGTDASCRAIVCRDETHEAVPADLIRRAALKAVGL